MLRLKRMSDDDLCGYLYQSNVDTTPKSRKGRIALAKSLEGKGQFRKVEAGTAMDD